MEKYKMLGVLGGLGPMATVYFYEMLTSHTEANCDQDHINMMISSRADTPDRTAFILGQSDENPLPVMIEEANRLVGAGASVLVLPCNTAHYFYKELSKESGAPIINIIEETVNYCAGRGMKRIGLLATEGTVRSQSYNAYASLVGIEIITPSPKSQQIINDIIYKDIKCGLDPDPEAFDSVANELKEQGAETVILGCTELSLIKKNRKLGKYFTDSLEVLASVTIERCGKKAVGFDFL